MNALVHVTYSLLCYMAWSVVAKAFAKVFHKQCSKKEGKDNHHEEKNAQYSARLRNASDPVYNRINNLYPYIRERDTATDEVTAVISAYQEVYMEIGMKAGARLLYQLMVEDEKQPAKSAK